MPPVPADVAPKNASAMLSDHLRYLDPTSIEKEAKHARDPRVDGVRIQKWALHSGTERSCTRSLPKGRMNDLKQIQPKTVECGRACANVILSRAVRFSSFFSDRLPSACFPKSMRSHVYPTFTYMPLVAKSRCGAFILERRSRSVRRSASIRDECSKPLREKQHLTSRMRVWHHNLSNHDSKTTPDAIVYCSAYMRMCRILRRGAAKDETIQS